MQEFCIFAPKLLLSERNYEEILFLFIAHSDILHPAERSDGTLHTIRQVLKQPYLIYLPGQVRQHLDSH